MSTFQPFTPQPRVFRVRRWLGIAALAGVALCVQGHDARAADADDKAEARIVVTGEASVQAAPDMAVVALTVRSDRDTAREALTENNEAMARVTARMKQAGVAERDLVTSGFSITPRIVYPQRNNTAEAPQIKGYTVSNSLTVRVRDLTRIGTIMDESVTLGVNQGGQLTFTNADTDQFVRQARADAVANAIDKAQTLTSAAGAKLGRILEISEQSAQPSRPIAMMRSMAAEASSGSVPLEAGETSYSVSVTISWAIEQ